MFPRGQHRILLQVKMLTKLTIEDQVNTIRLPKIIAWAPRWYEATKVRKRSWPANHRKQFIRINRFKSTRPD